MNLSIVDDPIALLSSWYKDAEASGTRQPDAMQLATATSDGIPSVRTVLYKGLRHGGISFVSNYSSRKGGELAANPIAALVFYWNSLGRQVRIEGSVTEAPRAESEAYFASRPRESQIGAWASHQSRPLASRDELEARYRALESKYSGIAIPCPAHWGMYILTPTLIEFWSEQTRRLNDRVAYKKQSNGSWTGQLINP